MRVATRRPGAALLAVIVFFAVASAARAYPTYTDGGQAGTFCAECHGDFDSGVYVSDAGTASWGTDLMEAHKGVVGDDCNVCHKSGPKGDVALNLSSGGDGLDPISCIGCHGRAQDRIGDASNTALCVDPSNVLGPCGDGAGLREHHAQNDVTECVTCHVNDLVPVGEDFLPRTTFSRTTIPATPFRRIRAILLRTSRS